MEPGDRARRRQRGRPVGAQLPRRRLLVPQGLRVARRRRHQLGAALRIGELPRDRVAQRPPAGAAHGRLPAFRAGGKENAQGHEPAGGARRQPPHRAGDPAAGRAQRRQVRGRLVELRRDPARGVPAKGRHLRLRERGGAAAPGLSRMRCARLPARRRREHGGRAGARGGVRDGRRPADQVHARHDPGARLPPVPWQHGDPVSPVVEPGRPAPLQRRAGGLARRPGGPELHVEDRHSQHRARRRGPDAPQRPPPEAARGKPARGGPGARRRPAARRHPRQLRRSCATWART